MANHRARPELGRAMTARERQDRFQHYDIDPELDALFDKIDWKRRNEAEKDIVKWVNTYCMDIFLEDPPPPKGEEVLRQMYNALDSHSNYMILMGRGSGKSVYELCTTMMALSTGIQKFIVIVSNNNKAAVNLIKDIWRMVLEPDTPFAQDYPEICGPYQIAKGSYRRKQMYKNLSTDISKTAGEFVFPRLKKADGTDYPTSASILTSRGISSGIRGLRRGTQRVTCVLLDDLQDSESASNPEQVEKIYQTIRKDIIPLAGKERLSIIQTATPIVQDDLVEKIKKDPSWKTTLFPAIISYPRNKHLWDEYFKIYDAERLEGDDKHNKSLAFYMENKIEMDDGVEVFNPARFSPKDGHISAIQKLLELEHNIGKAAFQAEYQMVPMKSAFAVDISPSKVASKVNSFAKLEVPDEYRYVTFGIDINPSYAISVVGMAWKVDTTGIVIFHKKYRVKINQKLPDTAYNQRLYDELSKVCDSIKQLGIKVHGVAIDCGGKQWDGVNLFCKQYKDLPVCAFAGRSGMQFNTYANSRNRLKDAVGRTVLCGNQAENTRSGSGFKYVFFDADWTKHSIQLGFNCVVGDVGSVSIYKADKDEHAEFCIEVSNEHIVSIQQKANGMSQYLWKSAEPHDDLDCCSMCRAVLSQLGVVSSNVKQSMMKSTEDKQRKLFMLKQRLKQNIKIV